MSSRQFINMVDRKCFGTLASVAKLKKSDRSLAKADPSESRTIKGASALEDEKRKAQNKVVEMIMPGNLKAAR